MALFGHSGSHTSQLIHSSLIKSAIIGSFKVVFDNAFRLPESVWLFIISRRKIAYFGKPAVRVRRIAVLNIGDKFA